MSSSSLTEWGNYESGLYAIEGQPQNETIASEDDSLTESAIRGWPDLSFELSEQNIFGGKLPTVPDARLRSVIRTLEATAPGALTETYPEPSKICKKIRGRLNNLFDRPIGVHEGPIDTGDARRRQLMSFEQFMDIQAEQYRLVNHPITQLTDAIYQRNLLRQQAKQNSPAEQIRVLSNHDIESLRDDLIILSDGSQIVETAKVELTLVVAELAAVLAIHHTIHPYGV